MLAEGAARSMWSQMRPKTKQDRGEAGGGAGHSADVGRAAQAWRHAGGQRHKKLEPRFCSWARLCSWRPYSPQGGPQGPRFKRRKLSLPDPYSRFRAGLHAQPTEPRCAGRQAPQRGGGAERDGRKLDPSGPRSPWACFLRRAWAGGLWELRVQQACVFTE